MSQAFIHMLQTQKFFLARETGELTYHEMLLREHRSCVRRHGKLFATYIKPQLTTHDAFQLPYDHLYESVGFNRPTSKCYPL